jgi:hypothetical protein
MLVSIFPTLARARASHGDFAELAYKFRGHHVSVDENVTVGAFFFPFIRRAEDVDEIREVKLAVD